MRRRIRLEVFGERMDAELEDGRWTLYRVGEGKRTDTGLVIPSFVTPDELEQYLFDLLHEAAKPSNPHVRRLHDPPVGLLLAAGLGTRYDPSGTRLKLLEPSPAGIHAGVPIAAAAARTLRSVVSDVVAVVRPVDSPAQERLHGLLAAEGCRLVACAQARDGMGASLACGVNATADASAWIVALADMPAVRPTTIAAVYRALQDGAASAAPFFDGRRGHPVGFGHACFAELSALEADEGARSVLRTHPPRVIDVDDSGCLFDIDRPAT